MNGIGLAGPFGQTQITTLLTNNPEGQNRWTPSPRMYAVTLPVADTVFDEATDGTKSFVREGIWSMAAEIRDRDAVPPVLKKLKKMRCKEWSCYLVTRDNQLVGRINAEGTIMYPLQSNSGSIDPKMMFRDAAATNKIMFGFDFDNLIKQEDLYVLQGEDLTTPVDFLRLQKNTDVTITVVGNPTTTSVVVDVKSDFATGLTPNNDVVGLDGLADFALFNETTGHTSIPITAIDEDPLVDGRYELTFGAQTSGDEMYIEMATPQIFFEGNTTFEIP